MNDLTRIEWADVPKGIVINNQLYCPMETPTDKVKCGMCDYLLSGKCKGVKPCVAFGENLHLRYVGNVVGVFVEQYKKLKTNEKEN